MTYADSKTFAGTSFNKIAQWQIPRDRRSDAQVVRDLRYNYDIRSESGVHDLIKSATNDAPTEGKYLTVIEANPTYGNRKTPLRFDLLDSYIKENRLKEVSIHDGLCAVEQFIDLNLPGRLYLYHRQVPLATRGNGGSRHFRLAYRPGDGDRRLDIIQGSILDHRFVFLFAQ